jgi:hypothetical protein
MLGAMAIHITGDPAADQILTDDRDSGRHGDSAPPHRTAVPCPRFPL